MYRQATALTGPLKDFALFLIMKEYMGQDNVQTRSYLADFADKCNNTVYLKYIDSLAYREGNVLYEEASLRSVLKDTTGKEMSMKRTLNLKTVTISPL